MHASPRQRIWHFFCHPLFCRRIALHIRAASIRVFVQKPVHFRLAVGYLGVDVLVEIIGLLELKEMNDTPSAFERLLYCFLAGLAARVDQLDKLLGVMVAVLNCLNDGFARFAEDVAYDSIHLDVHQHK